MGAFGFGPRLWPRMAGRTFDFSAGVLPAGATLTRASAGTRVDAGGALVSEGADVARFDFDPVTLACRGLLIEGAATNAFAASRDFSQAAWSKSMVTAGTTAIVETTASGAHYLSQTPAFTAGTPYCLSAAAREQGTKRYLVLFFQASAFGSSLYAKFDLAAGTIAYQSGVAAGIAPAPGGRWLCWASATAATTVAAGTSNAMLRLADAGGTALTYTGDGASGIDATDAQLEVGGAPTSRIVTGGAAASRAADVLVLDWRAKGVADGAASVRYTFDDGTSEEVATTVSGGTATVPTTLSRARLRRATAI